MSTSKFDEKDRMPQDKTGSGFPDMLNIDTCHLIGDLEDVCAEHFIDISYKFGAVYFRDVRAIQTGWKYAGKGNRPGELYETGVNLAKIFPDASLSGLTQRDGNHQPPTPEQFFHANAGYKIGQSVNEK